MGQELAWQLSARGCHISICDINEEGLARTVRGCAADVKVTTAVVDVANREQVNAWADATVQEHGKVNLIFNNAGVSSMDSFENANKDEKSFEDFEWVMGINLDGVINGCRAFLPYLKQTDDAYLLNTSSIFGMYTVAGQSAYHAFARPAGETDRGQFCVPVI